MGLVAGLYGHWNVHALRVRDFCQYAPRLGGNSSADGGVVRTLRDCLIRRGLQGH